MREVIPGLLWIGNARDARRIPELLRTGITAVVDLAIEEPPVVYPREVLYARLPLLDGAGNSRAMIRAAVELTATLIEEQVPTLVACSGGMSRSPAIVAAALAAVRQTSPDETLQALAKDLPHDVSPGLWAEIQAACGDSRAGDAAAG
jgi:hypothetical protein